MTLLKVGHALTQPAALCEVSWYDLERRTASGILFDPDSDVAASPSRPLGSWIEIINPRTGLSDIVQVIDRGPFVRGRCLDVSRGVAARLGFLKEGITKLWVFSLDYLSPKTMDALAKDTNRLEPWELGLLSGLP